MNLGKLVTLGLLLWGSKTAAQDNMLVREKQHFDGPFMAAKVEMNDDSIPDYVIYDIASETPVEGFMSYVDTKRNVPRYKHILYGNTSMKSITKQSELNGVVPQYMTYTIDNGSYLFEDATLLPIGDGRYVETDEY